MWSGERGAPLLMLHAGAVQWHAPDAPGAALTEPVLPADADADAAAGDGPLSAALRRLSDRLARASTRAAGAATPLNVLVSGQWAPLLALPWSDALFDPVAADAEARAEAAAQGLATAAGDAVRLDDRPGHGRARALAVWPAGLVAALQSFAAATGHQLARVQVLDLAAAAVGARQSTRRAPWTLVVDGPRLLLLDTAGAAPVPVHEEHDAALAADPAGRVAVLWQRVQVRRPAVVHTAPVPVVCAQGFAAGSGPWPPDLAPVDAAALQPRRLVQAAAGGPGAGADGAAWPWTWLIAAALALGVASLLAAQAWQARRAAQALAPQTFADATPRPADTADLRALKAEIRTVNGAIQRLNLPLARLLTLLQPPRGMAVQVTGLEASDTQAGAWKLSADASNAADMTSYLGYLASRRGLTARLVRHDLEGAGPTARYRFAMELQWQP